MDEYLEKISLFRQLRAEINVGAITAHPPPQSFLIVKYPCPLRVKILKFSKYFCFRIIFERSWNSNVEFKFEWSSSLNRCHQKTSSFFSKYFCFRTKKKNSGFCCLNFFMCSLTSASKIYNEY